MEGQTNCDVGDDLHFLEGFGKSARISIMLNRRIRRVHDRTDHIRHKDHHIRVQVRIL